MTKTCKKILTSVFLVLCAVVCLFAIAACNGTSETSEIYTVTIQTEEGPASGVDIQVSLGGTIYALETTDANGTATFELVPDEYDLELSNLPPYYSLPESSQLKLSKDVYDTTIELVKNFAYTIKLVQADGKTPYYYAGVTVTICTVPQQEGEKSNCLNPVPINADGIAIKEAPAYVYHVSINNLPANAFYYHDEEGYYVGANDNLNDRLTQTVTEMKIPIYTASLLDVTDTSTSKMNAAAKSAYAAKQPAYDADMQKFEAYKFSVLLAAGETKYFAVQPEMSGMHHIFTNASADGTVTSEGISYAMPNVGDGSLMSYSLFEAGHTYIFTAHNLNKLQPDTAEFVITTPLSTYITCGNDDSYLPLTIGSADTNAIVAFKPTEAGWYTFTASSDIYKVSLNHDADHPFSAPDEFCAPCESTAKEAKIENFLVETNVVTLGYTYYFTVSANAGTGNYPATVNFYIQKTGEVNDQFVDVTVKGTLPKETATHENQELHGIPMANSTTLTTEDGKYFYDGKQVYVKITSPIEPSRLATGIALAYMDRNATYSIFYAFSKPNSQGTVTTDYRLFLRGFKNYTRADTMGGYNESIPATLREKNCYANNVNEDGAYPLTEELMDFLKLFYQENEFLLSNLVKYTDSGSAWLFPCYYYDEITEADEIVGTYAFKSYTFTDTNDPTGNEDIHVGGTREVWVQEDGSTEGSYVPIPVTKEDYTLVVLKDGSFIIYDGTSVNDDAQEMIGSWSKSGSTYTFVSGEGDAAVTHTVTFSAGYVKLVQTIESNITITWEFDNNQA